MSTPDPDFEKLVPSAELLNTTLKFVNDFTNSVGDKLSEQDALLKAALLLYLEYLQTGLKSLYFNGDQTVLEKVNDALTRLFKAVESIKESPAFFSLDDAKKSNLMVMFNRLNEIKTTLL